MDLSPNGERLATAEFAQGLFEIHVRDLVRGTRERLDLDGSSWNPVWHPDGHRLSFTSLRTGNFDVFMVSSDGSNESELLAGDADEEVSAWLSDGERALCLIYDSVGGPQHWFVDTGNGERTFADFLPTYVTGASPCGLRS